MILPLDEENLSKEKPDPKVEQKRWKCDSCSHSFTQSGSLNNYSIHIPSIAEIIIRVDPFFNQL